MTNEPAIAAVLATGNMHFETPSGWRVADGGLREAVIEAVLNGNHVEAVEKALSTSRAIVFHDKAVNLTVRWSPT